MFYLYYILDYAIINLTYVYTQLVFGIENENNLTIIDSLFCSLLQFFQHQT